jgi:sulfur-oxidizing protein SoxB
MRLNGKPIEAAKNYKFTSWAPVTEGARGIPVWDIAASYLREKRFIKAPVLNRPTIINTLGG